MPLTIRVDGRSPAIAAKGEGKVIERLLHMGSRCRGIVPLVVALTGAFPGGVGAQDAPSGALVDERSGVEAADHVASKE
jgi:hypothetical protein